MSQQPDKNEIKAQTEEGAEGSIEELLRQMRAGNREAAATFISRYGTRIRKRIRGKPNPGMRRIFDREDIISALGRRLDLYVGSGRLRAGTEEQLWALVSRMADHAVMDKARVFRRLEQVEGEDSAFARQLFSPQEEEEIELALNLLDDRIDRQILSYWLAGMPHSAIGEHVGLAPTAVRKRWHFIKSRFSEQLFQELEPEVSRAQSANVERLTLRVGVPEFAPVDEVIDELTKLYEALSAYHISCGGTGLVIEDWDILVPDTELVEV